MTSNEKFLKAYRDFETAVKATGYDSVLAYEEFVDAKEPKDSNVSSIRLCRQCRNFLSHESKDFFEASKQMTEFLQKLAGELHDEYLSVKKFAIKQLITEDTKVQDAAGILLKRKANKPAPVINKAGDVVGFVSSDLICAYLAKNNINSTTKVKALMSTKNVNQTFAIAEETTPMKDISENLTYLIRNGKGTITGWY